MIDLNWGEIIAVFISCAIKPGLAGIPTAVFVFKFNFLEALLVCSAGGITGSFVFTYLIDSIIKVWNRFLDKNFPNRNKNKKKFSRKNRFIIKAKKNFGIVGISIISPVLLSIPLGSFLAIRFFHDRRKTVFWMSLSVVFWTVVLFFIYTAFSSTFKKMLG